MALKLDMKTQMLRFTKRLQGIVENASSKEVMKEVGDQAVRLVQQQAKLGNDYITGGKFKELTSDEYIEKRKAYSEYLHPRTRPRKSNVTATGQLIDSIEVSKIMPRSVELECVGTREKSPFGGAKTNAEVGYWVEYNGRHFLGLSDKSREKIRKFYDRIVKTILRRQR